MSKGEDIKRIHEESPDLSFGELADVLDTTENFVRDVLHGKAATSYKTNGAMPWRCKQCGGLVTGSKCKLCATREVRLA